MTDAEIQRLRELCLAMTPLLHDEEFEYDTVDEVWEVKGLDSYGMDCVAECENEGDARFVAAAREAMPKLLDEVERLRKQYDELCRIVHRNDSTGGECIVLTDQEWRLYVKGIAATARGKELSPEMKAVLDRVRSFCGSSEEHQP